MCIELLDRLDFLRQAERACGPANPIGDFSRIYGISNRAELVERLHAETSNIARKLAAICDREQCVNAQRQFHELIIQGPRFLRSHSLRVGCEELRTRLVAGPSSGRGESRSEVGDDPPAAPPPPRLTVNIECKTVTLDGMLHDVTSDLTLRWVKVLTEHPGEWIASSKLKDHDQQLDGARTSRLRQYLPDAIGTLIESDTGKGSRLNLSVAYLA